ncbi:MAG TPA: hypothetical protein DDY72_04000 [Verrucomicrobia bacterium]|nr:hypothetical protein [Verrucomicrobiota bacterium]
MDCRRSRQRCRASAAVVPRTQDTSVANAATISDSQKLCISAPMRRSPVKMSAYHFVVSPAKSPFASKKLMEIPFGMKP